MANFFHSLTGWWRQRKVAAAKLPVYGGLTDAINKVRAAHGRAPLKKDGRLTDVAMQWASYMAHNQVLDHGDFGGRIAHVYPNTAAGETIGMAASLDQVVAMWMASPPHRMHLLGDYTIVGTGKATAPNGSTYWCVDFDRP